MTNKKKTNAFVEKQRKPYGKPKGIQRNSIEIPKKSKGIQRKTKEFGARGRQNEQIRA